MIHRTPSCLILALYQHSLPSWPQFYQRFAGERLSDWTPLPIVGMARLLLVLKETISTDSDIRANCASSVMQMQYLFCNHLQCETRGVLCSTVACMPQYSTGAVHARLYCMYSIVQYCTVRSETNQCPSKGGI